MQRRPPLTSIVATCSDPESRWNTSWWPVSELPASCHDSLLIGAVTIASTSPASASRAASSTQMCEASPATTECSPIAK